MTVSSVLDHARRGSTAYDDIGSRLIAAAPVRGEGAPTTLAESRRVARLLDGPSSSPGTDLAEQGPLLRPRPIALPTGSFDHVEDGGLITATRAGEPDGVLWSFSPQAPPRSLLRGAADRDGYRPPLPPHDLPGIYWLPLPALVRAGRLTRMQDGRTLLRSDTPGAHLRVVVSHGRRGGADPDPGHRHAALLAWYLVAAVCDAVYVAHDRGLHVPRRHSPSLGRAVGRAGSEITESLIVTVLRPTLDAADLAAVRTEILDLEEVTAGDGVDAGRDDVGLARLRRVVATHPLLADLLAAVDLWYDHSCLPQEPRSPAEQAEYEDGRDRLADAQACSRTVVLLDDVADHLGRGWCVLDLLNAGRTLALDVVPVTARPARTAAADVYRVRAALLDLPHVVWRAVLDTEVFGVQTPAECLRRLGLAGSRDEDVPAVYAGLRSLGAPLDVPVDGGDVVTGIVPLPLVDETVLIPAPGAPREADAGAATTLDWPDVRSPSPLAAVAPFVRTGRSGSPTGHVVVVGGCEGECVLLSRGVLDRLGEIDRLAGATVTSLSWLSVDALPVGHMTAGGLRTRVVDADRWVVVTAAGRLGRCSVAETVLGVLLATGAPVLAMAVEATGETVVTRPATDATRGTTHAVERASSPVGAWEGGVFGDHLADALRAAVTGGGGGP